MARPALTFWRRLEPVGWLLALMCFGPKHRSGCALDVSTSGVKKWRNRDLSRKAHQTRRTSQKCGWSLCGTPVRVYPAWKGALLCLLGVNKCLQHSST